MMMRNLFEEKGKSQAVMTLSYLVALQTSSDSSPWLGMQKT